VEPKEKRKATGDRAEYDLVAGTISLSGNPRLEMADRKMYNAATITYDISTGKVWTTNLENQQVVIEFTTAGGGLSLDMLGGGGTKVEEEEEERTDE
jgi:lipopolysaccharide export system protein LptA